jgi:hypothetical protein
VASHGVRLGASGRLEVVRAAPPEDLLALRRAVDRLRVVAGSGAVEIVDVVDDGDRLEVVLAYAGRSPTGALSGDACARIGASIAAGLSDAHQRGIVHGALHREHVLVDSAGTARLCGFGSGDGSASDDVLALGVLLRELLDDADRTDAAMAVAGVIDRCCVDDASARPTMAAIAASLASAGRPARAIAAARPSSRQQRRVPIAVAIGMLVIVAIVLWPRPSGARSAPPAPTWTATTSTTSTTVGSRRVWPPAAPHVIEHDGSWTFGRDDDIAALVGDWDCDGLETPAVVARSGDVFVLDDWDDGAVARFVTTVRGAVAASVDQGPSCDTIVVRTADGRSVRPTLSAA